MSDVKIDLDGGRWLVDRKVPIALMATLALQTGAALVWAGGEARRISELEMRVERQSGVTERLARLEAGADSTRAALARIEAKLDRDVGR